MRLDEIDLGGRVPVDSYGPGGFRIGGVWRAGTVVLTPAGLYGVDAPLSLAALAPVLEQATAIDVVLVGQGAEIAPLAPDLRAALEAAGLGVEIMATPAACRTYNVLLAEDRRVAAVLMAV